MCLFNIHADFSHVVFPENCMVMFIFLEIQHVDFFENQHRPREHADVYCVIEKVNMC